LATADVQNGQHIGGRDHESAIVLGLDEQLLGEDFVIEDACAARRCDDVRTDGWQRFLQFLVRVVFVAKAAFKPTTAAGNLGRVERRFLHFRHLHRHGRHVD
jgi:hypothetical protein